MSIKQEDVDEMISKIMEDENLTCVKKKVAIAMIASHHKKKGGDDKRRDRQGTGELNIRA